MLNIDMFEGQLRVMFEHAIRIERGRKYARDTKDDLELLYDRNKMISKMAKYLDAEHDIIIETVTAEAWKQ